MNLYLLIHQYLMRTDEQIRLDGVRVRVQALGAVAAERFVALINRERFDDTEWRATPWADETVDTLAEKSRQLSSSSPNT